KQAKAITSNSLFWRPGVFPCISGNRQPFSGHNDESIDEQGISAGSIPDSPIPLGGLGREKVRSIRTPAVLSSLW
ncbi:hypothetical protein, partial [Enterococcus faecium]|uniref:hypothetical protein n=1 Tax=Enterococcus faecium TaxID=1352 RepID=UPI0039FB9AD5